jgi:hypothetical protein
MVSVIDEKQGKHGLSAEKSIYRPVTFTAAADILPFRCFFTYRCGTHKPLLVSLRLSLGKFTRRSTPFYSLS